MTPSSNSLRNFFADPVPIGTLCLMLLASLALAVGTYATLSHPYADSEARAGFAAASPLTAYENVARDVASFVSLSPYLNETIWQNYVNTLDIPARYPGIDLSYVRRVPQGQKFPYAIYPAAPGDRYAQRYGTSTPYGFNLATDPARASALLVARDTGSTTLSDAYADANGRSVRSLYAPVYWFQSNVNTVASRQSSLAGFVAVTFPADAVSATSTTVMTGARAADASAAQADPESSSALPYTAAVVAFLLALFLCLALYRYFAARIPAPVQATLPLLLPAHTDAPATARAAAVPPSTASAPSETLSELRASLTTMRWYVETLIAGRVDQPERRESLLKDVRDSSIRMLDLVESMEDTHAEGEAA